MEKHIRFEFIWPFSDEVPSEWYWEEKYSFNPDCDYQRLVENIIKYMPESGPSGMAVILGDKIIASWFKHQEASSKYVSANSR